MVLKKCRKPEVVANRGRAVVAVATLPKVFLNFIYLNFLKNGILWLPGCCRCCVFQNSQQVKRLPHQGPKMAAVAPPPRPSRRGWINGTGADAPLVIALTTFGVASLRIPGFNSGARTPPVIDGSVYNFLISDPLGDLTGRNHFSWAPTSSLFIPARG